VNVQIETLTDDQITALSDAVHAEEARREHLLTKPEIAAALAIMCDDDLRDFGGRLADEEQDRADKWMALSASHEIEQGEAREVAGDKDQHNLFVARCARLFRLAKLNAPEPIIAMTLSQVLKGAPCAPQMPSDSPEGMK
jgi:hypothetical protein